jgi:septal ring factor EnvC (AmiA/AmiB activator)
MRKILFVSLALLLQLLVIAQPANEKAELEKKRKQTLQEIEILNKQYNEIKKNKKLSLNQLAVVQRKIDLRNQVINDINKQVNSIDKTINSSYREMRRLQKDLDTLKINYAHNVVYAYKNRSNYDFLNFLFSASNFNDAIRRIAYMRAYRTYRTQQVDAINKTDKLYKEKIVQLTNNKKEKSSVLLDQSKEVNELLKDKVEQAAVVNEFKKKETEIGKTLAVKKKQAVALQNATAVLIKRIAKEEEEKRKLALKKAQDIKKNQANTTPKTNTPSGTPDKTNTTENPVVTTPVNSKPTKENIQQAYEDLNKIEIALGVNFESNRGKLPWPVDNGFVSTPFGASVVPGTNLKWNQDWITISSPVGSSVKAVFDGEVVSVSDQNGVSTVAVKHGNYVTMYSNLKSVAVNKGQDISRGTIIGKVDANMEGEGTIEFILLKGAQNLNPASWLRNR